MRFQAREAIFAIIGLTGCETTTAVDAAHPSVGASLPDAAADVVSALPDGTSSEADRVSSEAAAQPEAGAGIAHIVVTNTTANVLYGYGSDFAPTGAPLWLHIGSPELWLVVFGGSMCADGSHYDPSWLLEPTATSGQLDYDWNGVYIDTSGGCWQQSYVPPGTYPAKACAFAYGADAGIPMPGNPSGPGPYSDAGVETCVDFTVTLPASGAVTSSASW